MDEKQKEKNVQAQEGAEDVTSPPRRLTPGGALKILKGVLWFYAVVYLALGVVAFVYAASFAEGKVENFGIFSYYPMPVGVLLLIFGGLFVHIAVAPARERVLYLILLVAKWLGIIAGLITLFRVHVEGPWRLPVISWFILDVILSVALIVLALKGGVFRKPEPPEPETP